MFSIITTTYNAAATVGATMNSVKGQTYRDFEWIVVDDGSTDRTVSLVKESSDPRIRLIRQAKIGRANALNVGIAAATRPYVCIIDADDLWHRRKLEFAAKSLEEFPNTDILCTDLKTFSSELPVDDPVDETVDTRVVTFKQMVRYNYVCHSSAAIRRELAMYNPKRTAQVDYELWLRLADQGANIRLQMAKLTYHRLHVNQSFEGKRNLEYRISAIRLTQKYAVKNKLWLTYCWLPIFYFLGFVKQLFSYRKIN